MLQASMLCAWLALVTVLLTCRARGMYICLIPAGNSVICDPAQAPSTYTGMEVELLRNMTSMMGLSEYNAATYSSSADLATDMLTYAFRCAAENSWVQMMADLVDNSTFTTCAMASGEITITPARVKSGVQFSFPYYHTGLAVMIYSNPRTTDMWAFFKPFQPQTWIAFLATLAIVPLFVWIVEQLCTKGFIVMTWDSVTDMRHAVYETMLCVFNLQVHKVKSFAAQISVLCFCFLVLIMMATYTAQLSAVLTTSNIGSTIGSISDLRGLAVAAHPIYVTQLKRSFGVTAAPINYEGLVTYEAVVDQLAANTLNAFIVDALDAEAAVYHDNRDCHVSLLPDMVLPHDYGFAFHAMVPAALVTDFSKGVILAQAVGVIEQLTNRYLVYPSKCDSSSNADLGGITFEQMAGLWIILAAGLGTGLVWSAWTLGRHVYLHMQADTEWATDDKGSLTSRKASKRFSSAMTSVFTRESAPNTGDSSRRNSALLGSRLKSSKSMDDVLAQQQQQQQPSEATKLMAPSSPSFATRQNWMTPAPPGSPGGSVHMGLLMAEIYPTRGANVSPRASVQLDRTNGGGGSGLYGQGNAVRE